MRSLHSGSNSGTGTGTSKGFDNHATETQRRHYRTADGDTAVVTFETPYFGDRSAAGERPDDCPLPNYNRVQFHAFTSSDGRTETRWYLGMLREMEAKRMERYATQREMRLETPETDGRQYAVTSGGMRVRVK